LGEMDDERGYLIVDDLGGAEPLSEEAKQAILDWAMSEHDSEAAHKCPL